MASEGLHDVMTRAYGKSRVLFLDYDGTLVPFAETPERARPDVELLEVLDRLARRPDTAVHVVSGRPRSSLEGWLGHIPMSLHAEHGFWRRRDHRGAWVAPLVPEHGRWMPAAVELMEVATRGTQGSFVERKTASLAWHYRRSDPSVAARARLRLRAGLRGLCERYGLALVDGSCVVEIRVHELHKGDVVREVLRDVEPSAFVLAAGDDAADEDMFEALPNGGVAICAGLGASIAPYRVSGHAAVRDVLFELLASPERQWVLVVEDEPSIRRAVLDVLADAGVSAFAVPTGAHALERLREGGQLPSVVVTDMMMPVLDGRALVARMRRDPALAAIPVVMMTGVPFTVGLPKDVLVMQKPVDGDYLVSVVRERMARRPSIPRDSEA